MAVKKMYHDSYWEYTGLGFTLSVEMVLILFDIVLWSWNIYNIAKLFR